MRDADVFMSKFAPSVKKIMMDSSNETWGELSYQVVDQ